MFALPPLLILIVFDYIKPVEIFPILAKVPFLYLLTGLAIFMFVVDVRVGVTRLKPTPQLVWAGVFFLWCLITAAIKAPQALPRVVLVAIPITLYLLIGHAVQTFRHFQMVAGLILAIGLFLGVLGVHQKLAINGCHYLVYSGGFPHFEFDGRECEKSRQCYEDGKPGVFDYACEHVGLLGTSSAGGRIRYRGTLEDPNELALAFAITLPFAFAVFDRKRGLRSGFILVAACVLFGLCAVYTQSRGGQIVFLTVLGVYFTRRIGWKGLVIGLVLAAPIMLLGGRSGGDTDASTEERLGAWAAGIDMIVSSPIFGVGCTQFTENWGITSHSAYILSCAELGVPGLLLFSILLYISVKVPYTAMRLSRVPGTIAPVAETWAVAMFAAFLGIIVGIIFLSYTYKEILWIYFGLSGAFYQCMRRHYPSFSVTIRGKEIGILFLIDLGLLVFIHFYLQRKGF